MSTAQIPPNELRPDLLASASLNPYTQHNSASRIQMFGSHLSQALVIEDAQPRRITSGVDREFGRFTFNVKFPCNAEVIKVIHKYPPTVGVGAIKENPVTAVIYEDVETRQIGVLMIPTYHCRHQHFGFRYKKKPIVSRLVPGMPIAKDTILADSPAVDDHGNYAMGTNANVAFMSLAGIIEDGIIISKSFAKRLKTKGFESRVATWGTNWYPLNLYGTPDNYKPFPDVGDKIRDDGLLFAMRRYDDLLAPVEMTPESLMEPDYIFDKLIYAEPGAKVVDVNVRHDNKYNPPPTPVGMEAQCEKYYRAQVHFYDQLLKTYNELRSRRKESLVITPAFHRLLVEALTYKGEDNKGRVTWMYQRVPLDDWRVEVHFEYDLIPTKAFKITDSSGGKGVVCDVWEDEDMPVDEEGNRADMITDGTSIIKRMNLARLYEPYINATSRMVTNQVRKWMHNPTPENIEEAWAYVLRYYQIVSPRMYELLTGPSYDGTPRSHLDSIVKDGIYLWVPTDNPAYSPEVIQQLRTFYPIHIGPVTYRGRSGNVVRTAKPVLVAELYVMLLEKTGGDWSGVSSAKLQHFGIPARMTKHDKYSLPGRANPVRILGESEVRLLAAAVGGDPTAEILEMSNSPSTHKAVVANILRSEKPSAIEKVIDRREIPRGGSRALTYVNHALQCAGMEFYYQPEQEDGMVYYADSHDTYSSGISSDFASDDEETIEVEEPETTSDDE